MLVSVGMTYTLYTQDHELYKLLSFQKGNTFDVLCKLKIVWEECVHADAN